ncbi:HEAT repeat domain-containing protein [Micromonospora sp. NPDC050495]|uniref:HEAT repeat domain-containing protein n=1 Tax=Micromonospora sp. NPDC050495 TaxID=3154936 RepID=UPI0033E8EC0E
MSSPPATRRSFGAWGCGRLGSHDVELLAAAAADPDPRVRSQAVGSIPDPVGDDWAFAVLYATLGDLDEQVRVSAVSRLGYTGRADAVAPLVALGADRSRGLTPDPGHGVYAAGASVAGAGRVLFS